MSITMLQFKEAAKNILDLEEKKKLMRFKFAGKADGWQISSNE